MSLPLAGMLVVSIEQAVAAPFATRQLADLGARVIKIERDSGDFARAYDSSVNGLSSYFVWLNRGKESVVLDLKTPEGLAALTSIIARADVFVQNLLPGAVERLGLGADDALALNPRLIHTSISGYGAGGPMADKRAYDLLIQCETGLLSVTGTPEEAAKVGVSIADIAAGMYAYSGILASLLRRSTTGTGDVIEVSMLEALGEWVSQPMLYAEHTGRQPARSGAQHPTIAPYGPYTTRDGRVFFGIQNPREWERFCESVIGTPELAGDERFATNELRVRNRSDLDTLIGRALAAHTTADVLRDLDYAGIANAQLRDMHGFATHPQLAARNRWRDVASPVGPIPSLLPPATMRGFEPRMGAIPELGQHTAQVLAEFTGS